MSFKKIIHTMTILIVTVTHPVYSTETETDLIEPLPPHYSPRRANNELLSCKTNLNHEQQEATGKTLHSPEFDAPFQFLNSKVKKQYNTMRSSVISHVTISVAMSVLSFDLDAFAAENIATYVSVGTKPFLPFRFANGVKITKVTSKGGTIVYRAEMPVAKNHNHALPLTLAGKISAQTTVCNDMKMVDDLLGRNILIQYDYYDTNGVFFSSFTIKG